MEVSAKITKETFKPVELTIQIESIEEAEVIYALFNYIPYCEVMRMHAMNPSSIRDVLNDVIGNIRYSHITDELNKSIKS